MTIRDRLCCWPAFWQLIFGAIPALFLGLGWAIDYLLDRASSVDVFLEW